MNLLSVFAQEMQDFWSLFFPQTVREDENALPIEVEDALPIGVETCYQRISSLIQQDASYRSIILDSRDFMPPFTLGPAALSSGPAVGSLTLFNENQNKFSRSNGTRRSILDQIAYRRIVASADFDTHLHKLQP